jgi:FHA domain
MPTCPGGHDTDSTDFCHVCGIRVGGPAPAPAPAPATIPRGAGNGARSCPQCGADGPGLFCETCGYSFAAGQPGPGRVPAGQSPAGPGGAAPAWTAVVTADRAQFDRTVAAGPDSGLFEFPAHYPERRFPLSRPEMRIGRRSAARGLTPEIDLTGPPLDPGISHLHAVLTAEPDGAWTVHDPGSANGTLVNGQELARGARVRLRDGDRVSVGAWTVLTIQSA